ncbi:MAG TPA: VCBS repeat-containing protein [Polyangia bacterium]|nr:VCBS repeat-containing protein [Polyangia bacterium]
MKQEDNRMTVRSASCLLAFSLVSVYATAGRAQYTSVRKHLTLDPSKSGPKRGAGLNDLLRIVPIYWNNTNTSCGGNDSPTVTEAQLQNFYAAVSLSRSYYGWIKAQYHTPAVLDSVPGVPLKSSTCDFSTGNINNILAASIRNGTLPKDSTGGISGVVYAIHFGPRTSVQVAGGTSFLCATGGTACAFNTTMVMDNRVVSWYAIPDPSSGLCNTNCTFGSTPLDSLTMMESHELIEALTDPAGSGWENRTQSCNCSGSPSICQPCNGPNSTLNQIGDLCVGPGILPVTIDDGGAGHTTVVQQMWSNVSNQCRGATVGAAGATLSAFSGPNSGTSVVLSGLNSGDIRTAVPNTDTAVGPFGSFTVPFPFSTDDSGRCPDCWTSFALESPTSRSILAGDFDGDGFGDLAITGPNGWLTIPIARSRGFFPWRATNQGVIASPAPPGLGQGFGFPIVAGQFHLQPVAGDFNGDGLTDIAMVGGPGWQSIPVAFSTGDGQGHWWSTNNPDNGFNDLVRQAGNAAPIFLAADFNGDGLSDLALVGINRTPFIAVALSKGDGTFSAPSAIPTTYDGGGPVTDFSFWSALPGVKAVAGDFNGDGLGDIALTGGPGWQSIPLALGTNGSLHSIPTSPARLTSFTIVNQTDNASGLFNSFSSQIGTQQLVAGDFDANGTTDLALTGGLGWSSIPVAFTGILPTGFFIVRNITDSSLQSFSESAAQSGSVAQANSRFVVHGF